MIGSFVTKSKPAKCGFDSRITQKFSYEIRVERLSVALQQTAWKQETKKKLMQPLPQKCGEVGVVTHLPTCKIRFIMGKTNTAAAGRSISRKERRKKERAERKSRIAKYFSRKRTQTSPVSEPVETVSKASSRSKRRKVSSLCVLLVL